MSSQWNPSRFVKTLSYFGVLPCLSNLSWWQRLVGNPITAPPMTPLNNRVLFNFTQATEDIQRIWGALDDVVMGGVSESGVRLGASGAIFSGNVSTANSGGFASIRTRNFEPPLDLRGYEGVLLRVRGDGNRYKFMLRSETRWDGVAYCYSFDTVPQTWIEVAIPFTACVPVFRAKTIRDGSALNTAQVQSLQLMLSKFEYDGALNPQFTAGAFQLEVESIQAYGSVD